MGTKPGRSYRAVTNAAIVLSFLSLIIWLMFAGIILSIRGADLSAVSWILISLSGVGITMASAYFAYQRTVAVTAELELLRAYAEAQASSEQLIVPPEATHADIERTTAAVSGTAQRFSEEIRRLEITAYTDPVTGLPNRTQLYDAMDTHFNSNRGVAPAGFVLIRLEGLNQAAESLGSLGSHALLRMVAERFSDNLDGLCMDTGRAYLLASMEATTFGLFLPGEADRAEVSTLVKALTIGITAPFQLDGRHFHLSLAGGIALAPDDGDRTERLIANAELASAQVEKKGRSGFEFFTPRLDRIARGRTRLENELRSAVASQAFKPVFQPKICLKTGMIYGVEALARWNRAEGRIISPAAFIPIAEQIGLIEDVGEQILRSACESAAEWIRKGHLVHLAVNVSPRQFERGDFTDVVIDALRQAGLPPRWLELEITETMAVSNPVRVAEVMRPLRAMGVKLAIDDFGTGHANLSLLTQLPFDVFKIDRQFVSALYVDKAAPAIVEMILAMAKTLDLETVAEGIETVEQAAFLTERDCTLGQGFLYSKGLPHDEVIKLFESWEAKRFIARSHLARAS
ncbi:MAG: EAL domain-containing protein [Pseudomonadota bacterium]